MGTATLPFIYLYFGLYVACWSTVAPTCEYPSTRENAGAGSDALDATEILPTMLRSKGIGIYMFVQSCSVTYNQ